MNHDETNFTPENLDDQIEHPTNWLAPDERRMLWDLNQTYKEQQNANAQSLQHVWTRLERERQGQHARNAPIDLQQRKRTMKDTSSLDGSSRGNIKRTLSLLVAVLVVAIVAGSAALIFNSASNAHKQGGNTANKPKPTSTPVVNASGIYITYMNKQGRYVASKIDSKTHKPVWTYERKDLNDTGDPIVYGDTVYLNASDDMASKSHLIALDATTGKERWDVEFKPNLFTDANGSGPNNMGYLTPPVISDGQVFVEDRTGTVFAFNSKTGKQNWTYKSGASALVSTYFTDPNTGKKDLAGSTIYTGSIPTVSNGVLYSAQHNIIFAVDIKTGKQIWKLKPVSDDQVFNDAQVIDGVIYAISCSISEHHAGQVYQSYVFAFNATDGKQNWKNAVDGMANGGLAIDSGRIYVIASPGPMTDNGSTLNVVHAINMQGKEIWHRDFSDPVVYTLSAGSGYVSVSGGTFAQGKTLSYTLFVLNGADGHDAWKKDIIADPASIVEGVLYVKGEREVIAYDLATHAELWRAKCGSDLEERTDYSFPGLVNVVP
ncbi:PQQ-binding-like beta-propeller repeat protein [Ktedonospora formicarum]|uniref:Pyrrolo-quinoline quinone repeat domain-containing protein n=1 Tax=Ktedonospora formicarum TaxID=2778364 RepID=A0A8J3HZA0_9CHLR|nr:PQQ-binding-like beta-propeller repeat protein [Ktedonospora formicarum]GHO46484.1 hypothetical protein KSX_46470 [Ktedonospora formicarum]